MRIIAKGARGILSLELVLLLGYVSIMPVMAQEGAGVFRVAPTGQDVPGCGSVIQPCHSIQYAVNEAVSGDMILVAEGEYKYDPALDPCKGRIGGGGGVVCFFDKSLTILGGYTPDNWMIADPATNLTVINGEHKTRGVRVQKSYSSAPSTSLHMEGFTIKNGYYGGATSGSDDDTFAFGGGLFIEQSPLVLRNMVFLNNTAVGGTTTQLYGGKGSGGALAINATEDNVTLELENVTFKDNTAQGGTGAELGGDALGGALFTYGVRGTGKTLTFHDNAAIAGGTNGSGRINWDLADALGGAEAIEVYSDGVFQGVPAVNNVARGGDETNGEGGGAYGGAIYVEMADFTLLDAEIKSNEARAGSGVNTVNYAAIAEGGGIQSDGSRVVLKRVYVLENAAYGGDGTTYGGAAGGGGIALTSYSQQYPVQIENLVITDNYVQSGSGTIVGGGGGGLWLQGVDADIVHTTFAGNEVSQHLLGQGLILLGWPATKADMAYNIIADHTGMSGVAAVHVQEGAAVTFKHGLFANNTDNDNHDDNYVGPPGSFSGLETMIEAPSAGFISPNDRHLLETSVAKDAAVGSNTVLDIDKEQRCLGILDIGADEYLPPIWVVVTPIESESLRVRWSVDLNRIDIGNVDYYNVIVDVAAGVSLSGGQMTCEEALCEIPLDVGLAQTVDLTGLTNYQIYTVSVEARSATGNVLATSNLASGMVTDIFVYLPAILR
jgi:hypothetical protein